MTEKTQQEAGQEPDAQESQPTFTSEYVTELREEAKANRLKYQAAELQLKERQDAETKAEAERLAKQGEWQELATQRQAEIERLQVYEAQVQGFIDEAEKNNAAFIEQVPEDKRGLIPTHYNPRDLQTYLQTNRDLLLGQPTFTPPSTNGGAGTYQKKSGQFKPLTQTELAIAKKLNLTPEQYQEGKAKVKG